MSYDIHLSGEIHVIFPDSKNAATASLVINNTAATRKAYQLGSGGNERRIPADQFVENNSVNFFRGLPLVAYCDTTTELNEIKVAPIDSLLDTYIEPWLNFIIGVITPLGGVANGEISWEGSECEDKGTTYVIDNKIVSVPIEVGYPTIEKAKNLLKGKEDEE